MSTVLSSPPNWGKVIRAAIGRNAAKFLERELDISRGQARRIAWSGHVPEHLQLRFFDAIGKQVAVKLVELAAVDKFLRDAERHSYLRALAAATAAQANRGAAQAGR